MLISSNEEKIIVKKLTGKNLDILCFDQNGSHVIEKIIVVFEEIEREYLNKYIMDNLIRLSMDINGNVLVRAFLVNIKSEYFINKIVIIFGKETNNLCLNQFGSNIIITFLDIYGNYSIKIINSLIKNIVNLSISKYSSNVILFLLDYLKKHIFNKFLDCLKIIFIDENNFKEMIKNKFSSFVIEKSFQIIIGIDENYFKKNIKSNFIKELNNNFNSSDEDENDENNINNDTGENQNGHKKINSDNDNDDNNNIIKNDDDILDYDNFILFKNKIFYIFENNASNKEKEKVINLLKQNYTFNNYVNNKETNGYNKNHKNC